MLFTSLLLLSAAAFGHAWLPASPPTGKNLSAFTGTKKIRGVNLGSHFIIEPYMAADAWLNMGCGQFPESSAANAELDCIKNKLGGNQTKANMLWQAHWANWTTQADITRMRSYGLNTIRIPLGYWIIESLVNHSLGEIFPQGGMASLINICTWATNAGMYIVLDLHGAPGSQEANQPFTGQYISTINFFQNSTNAERAYQWLEAMTSYVHNTTGMANVGALEVLNEPLQMSASSNPAANWTLATYYPTAINRIRAREKSLGVSGNSSLHITMMDDKWGVGGGNPGSTDPTEYMSSNQTSMLLFDDHNYEDYFTNNQTQAYIINYACNDNRAGSFNETKWVGEWSLLMEDYTPPTNYTSFYSKYFSAQMQTYEKTLGWTFWSWNTSPSMTNKEQWNYQAAVAAGIINSNLDTQYAQSVC